MDSTVTTKPHRRPFRLQEGGLILVILFLGALLTFFGGSVKTPKFNINSDGTRERVFTTNAAGEKNCRSRPRNLGRTAWADDACPPYASRLFAGFYLASFFLPVKNL